MFRRRRWSRSSIHRRVRFCLFRNLTGGKTANFQRTQRPSLAQWQVPLDSQSRAAPDSAHTRMRGGAGSGAQAPSARRRIMADHGHRVTVLGSGSCVPADRVAPKCNDSVPSEPRQARRGRAGRWQPLSGQAPPVLTLYPAERRPRGCRPCHIRKNKA